MNERIRRHAMMLALGVVTTGCSTGVSVEEFTRYLEDRQALRLAVQVCLPDKTAFFDELNVDVTNMPENVPFQKLAQMFRDAYANRKYTNPYSSTSTVREYQTIRQWRTPTSNVDFPKRWIPLRTVKNVKGIMSYGGGAEYLQNSTESNQAIFSAYTSERPDDVVAISVALLMYRNGKEEWVDYWFRPPKKINPNGYTKWIMPLSEEGQNERAAEPRTWWLLVHGEEMPVYKVSENAPRIRYTLLSKEQYGTLNQEGRRAMSLVNLQYLTNGIPIDNERVHFVPAKQASIPPC